MESTEKVKRLPRSAKKRLRYEKLRQLRKESDKKKKKKKKNTNTSNESDSNGKVERRLATERLEQVNRDGLAPVICIDCSYNDSMSTKVDLKRKFVLSFVFLRLGIGKFSSTNWTMLQFESSCRKTCSIRFSKLVQ